MIRLTESALESRSGALITTRTEDDQSLAHPHAPRFSCALRSDDTEALSGIASDREWPGQLSVKVPSEQWTPKVFQDAIPGEHGRLNLRGDLDLLVFAFYEVRRSYDQLPARLFCKLVLQMRVRGPLLDGDRGLREASLESDVTARRPDPTGHSKRTAICRD